MGIHKTNDACLGGQFLGVNLRLSFLTTHRGDFTMKNTKKLLKKFMKKICKLVNNGARAAGRGH